MNGRTPRHVLLVGAKFGALYANAFLGGQPGLELVGLLARGSPRARRLAGAFGIPLHTDIADLPRDLDIACVVVRAAVAGGAGSEIAEKLLRRGLHVIQEHPVHPDELMRLQALAHDLGRIYWVNSFYPHIPCGRRFIDCAGRIRARLGGEAAHFAHATTSRQLLFSTLDLLLQAHGAPEDGIGIERLPGPDTAFHTIRLDLPGTDTLLRLQSYLDPADPDLHSLVMHDLTLGWPSGSLSLGSSFGPVSWIPTLRGGGHQDPARSLYGDDGALNLDECPASVLHPASTDWRHGFEVDGPDGVGRILRALCLHLDGGPAPADLTPRYQATLARLWRDVLRCAGPARECALSQPVPIGADVLQGLSRAGSA